MAPLIHILHLEDDPADAELIQAKIEEAELACRITRVQTGDEFETALGDGSTHIILADYHLPMYDGMSALRLAHERCPEIPFIFVSGTMGEEAAIKALTQGATDYVLKQNLSRLASAVQRALQEAGNQRERRQAQEALQHSNEMLRAIIEAAPVAIIGLDLDGHVRSVWNPAAEKMLGWSAQDVMGRPLPTVPADHQAEFRSFREQIRKGMTLDGIEVRRQRRDGTPIDYSIYASPLRDAQGRISGNITVLVDITERKRAEAALRASEARYIDLYDNAPDMYVSVNAQAATVENCNQTLADSLGLPKAEIIGRPVFEIYHPQCRGQAKEAFNEFLENGEIHDRELQLRRKDGSKLDVSLNVSAVRDGNGAIVFSRSTLRDITERRRNSRINAARLRLMQFAVTHSLDELLEETVNEAENLTESLIGFYHFVDDDQKFLTLQNWSARTKSLFCKARGKERHYTVAEAGVWVDCIRQRKPVVHNDYMALTHRKGLPEGHAQVIRELVVPVIRGENIKAILGVGNKPADYSEKDVEAMSLMADLAWEISERKQAEQQVALMSFALNAIHEAAFLLDENARFQYVNDEACRVLGYSRDELLTMGVTDINPGFPMERWPGHWADLKQQGALTFEGELKTRDDRVFPVEINANYFEYEGRSYDLGLARDITERQQAEREHQANLQFFESMDKINRAIQGADDLEEMMKDLLDVVLSIFDCDRAFLLYPCDPESPGWNVPMERNKPEYPGIRDLKIEMAMDTQIAEKYRILRAADGPVAFGPGAPHALPEDVSRQFGFKSMLAMAIYPKTGHPWEFGIHQCAHARVWTAEEMRVFEAVGRRLADGLSSLLSYRDLRKNEAFLNNIVEHIPNMLFVKDAQTLRFVRFNKAGEQLLGYTRKELLGKTDHDVFAKEIADFFSAKDRQVLDGKELVDIAEETIRNRRKEERILHTKKIPILNETGAPQYLLGISEDITERKQAEASIRKLSQVVEQSPVSIIITDVEGRIEYINTKFARITGYSPAEVLGRNPRILKSGKTPAEEYRRLWETISKGDVWQGEFHNRKKNGELFWEQATIAPVKDADNVITHYVAVKEDITERKKLERQLRQAQKLEAIGTLAGGIAHDFNNILSAIIGFTELAMDTVEKDSPAHSDLMQVLNAGRRAKELVFQILTFSRQREQKQKNPVNIKHIAKEVLKLIRPSLPTNIEIRDDLQSNSPVNADPTQIHQVIMNLCTNAGHAMQKNGGILEMALSDIELDSNFADRHPNLTPGPYLKLTVSDTGCGMSADVLERIFDPFFTTKAEGEGTGLGLSVVHGIVKSHGGIITAYSEPGRGSTFNILLPVIKTGIAPEKTWEGNIPTGTERILFIDDETALAKLGARILQSLGYEVTTRTSSLEALELFKAQPDRFDLVITDMTMPNMTGDRMAEEMMRIRTDIPIILCTGFSARINKKKAIAMGIREFVLKPIIISNLARKIRMVLDQPGNHR